MDYESVNPFSEQPLKSFTEYSDIDVEQILAQADGGYRQTWRTLSFEQRGASLKSGGGPSKEQRAIREACNAGDGNLFRGRELSDLGIKSA